MPSPVVTMRIDPAGDAWLRQVVRAAGVDRSVVLRAMFSVATRHPDEVTAKIQEVRDGKPGRGDRGRRGPSGASG